MSKLVATGIRKNGRWFTKTDPKYGELSLEPVRKYGSPQAYWEVVDSLLGKYLK